MNLTKYFLDNFDENKYPYYHRRIKNYDLVKWSKYPCEYIDDDEIIMKWKSYTHPGKDDEEIVFEFLLLSFYLLNERYEIEEHPKLLFKIDAPEYISEGILRMLQELNMGQNLMEQLPGQIEEHILIIYHL